MGEVTSIQDAYCWNLTRIAEGFELHRDTVRKRLKDAGVRPARKRGNASLYRLADVAPALFAANPGGVPDKYTVEDLLPKDRKEWFQSENERLKFQEKIRELIPEGEYRDDLSGTLKKVAAFFDSLPDKMERRRVFSPVQLEELERAADEFRNQLNLVIAEAGDHV